MRTWASAFLSVFLVARGGEVFGFIPSLLKYSGSRKHSTTSLGVIFTKLSDESLAALQTAQEEASKAKCTDVDESHLLLGLTCHPGRAKTTLEQYRIDYENILDTLKYLGESTTKAISLSDFNDETVQLPYSNTLQQTLFEAGSISQKMGSDEVDSEHLLLSLLQYKEVDGLATAATRGDNCPAMELFWHQDATLEGEDVCQTLLKALMEPVEKESKPKNTRHDDIPIPIGPDRSTKASDKAEAQNSIKQFGTDLTQMARDGELDTLHGREDELQACFRILLRRRKNNVCVIGEAGVGKSALAEGIAQILVSDECPALMKGYRMVSLEVSSLISGTKYRGEFEERLREIVDEIASGSIPTILFLDEMHTLMGTGSTDGGGVDAANILKPYLSRGKLKVVGATTIDEYNKCVSNDAAMERRFQPVLLKEPTVVQTVDILKALVPSYQQHHRVVFSEESLEAAAKLSHRYIADRWNPDKSIDLLDEAGALATLSRVPNEPPPEVSEDLITSIVSEWSGIPSGQLQMDEMERLSALENKIAERIKGQKRAVLTVAKAIRRARTGIRNPTRPIASFLFCGPTGTGKTELCKTLAETYFGSERDLIRIDMSEYMERNSITRLTGPPPGYRGYDEGGQLTEAVRRAPHSVILLDELEKAHSDVLSILLQVMDDGILTDGKGRTVSFKNTVIIMTSNIGSKRVLEESMESKSDYAELARIVTQELLQKLRPEFLNRIDDIVVFEPLNETELQAIAEDMILAIAHRAKLERNIDIEVAPRLVKKMVKEGSQSASQFGARPMRRAVQRLLEDAISEAVVQNFLRQGDSGIFDTNDDLECSKENSIEILVTRISDGECLSVEFERSSRDLQVDILPANDDSSEEVNGLEAGMAFS